MHIASYLSLKVVDETVNHQLFVYVTYPMDQDNCQQLFVYTTINKYIAFHENKWWLAKTFLFMFCKCFFNLKKNNIFFQWKKRVQNHIIYSLHNLFKIFSGQRPCKIQKNVVYYLYCWKCMFKVFRHQKNILFFKKRGR